MNCIIDKSILRFLKQGEKAEVIRRYIRMKYRIDIDLPTLNARVKNLRQMKLV